MRKQNQRNSILKAFFWCIFLFAFLMLPIGCNKTSKPGSTNLESQDNVKSQEIAEIQDAAEPQEVAETREVDEPQVTEAASESNKIEIASLDRNDDWDIQFSIGHQVPIGPVDIKVYIDDKLAVNQVFDYDGQRMTPFYFKLDKGEHELRLESEKGNASFKQVFNITGMVKETYKITGRQWVDIIYTFNPMFRGSPGNVRGQFFFRIQNERPVRM